MAIKQQADWLGSKFPEWFLDAEHSGRQNAPPVLAIRASGESFGDFPHPGKEANFGLKKNSLPP
ncbi:MAG: hypothetical protein GTO53_07835 [Planctomycetales bacterium]|nr:hypothetical protein [Planctomycetales bacterium]NIM09046.1 hypothetical protein [Planctomycetales bacterium]NIN08509.1 hypothetical protein [Planctomycetales bacterium]NIN77643.1 hypothetical protein [Planctomycetales bacterium]NIO34806.1 hypothetical protein [Planctomycetales bacterium]